MSQATICDHCGEQIINDPDGIATITASGDYHDYCKVLIIIADLPAESQLKVRNARGKWTKLGGKQEVEESDSGTAGIPIEPEQSDQD